MLAIEQSNLTNSSYESFDIRRYVNLNGINLRILFFDTPGAIFLYS